MRNLFNLLRRKKTTFVFGYDFLHEDLKFVDVRGEAASYSPNNLYWMCGDYWSLTVEAHHWLCRIDKNYVLEWKRTPFMGSWYITIKRPLTLNEKVYGKLRFDIPFGDL